MTTRSAGPSQNNSSTLKIGLVVLGALVVAAIIAAITVGNSGSDFDAETAQQARIPTSGGLAQTAAVTTAGAPLPRLDGPSDPAVGQPAPSITASYFDSSEATINFADGQPRALIFVAHWCPHCQDEVSSLVQRFTAEGIRNDVEIVAISTGVDAGAPNYPPSAWLLKEQWPLPVLRDSATGNLASDFGLSGFPFMVLVDGAGNIVKRQSGSIPESEWNATLDLALTNQSVNG